MGKIAFLILLALVVYALWRGSARLRRGDAEREGSQTADGNARGATGNALPERMVRCEQCGVHLPASESVVVNRRVFCSHDHARSAGE